MQCLVVELTEALNYAFKGVHACSRPVFIVFTEGFTVYYEVVGFIDIYINFLFIVAKYEVDNSNLFTGGFTKVAGGVF